MLSYKNKQNCTNTYKRLFLKILNIILNFQSFSLLVYSKLFNYEKIDENSKKETSSI